LPAAPKAPSVAICCEIVIDILHEKAPVPEFSNSVLEWMVAFGVAAAWLVALLVMRQLIRRYDRQLADRPEIGLMRTLTAALAQTKVLFMLVVVAASGISTLSPSGIVTRIAHAAVMIALIWQVGIWSTVATNTLLERRRQQVLDTDRATAGSLNIIGVVVRSVIWIVVVLLILENAGVDVSALMAGLGIGGVAVALALQNILGDLFASLAITVDRPFVVGDLLMVENYAGKVEYIGLKSTRLRSIGGEQIIMSNADLLRSRLRNFGRLRERQVEFTLGIDYATSWEMLERIPSIIEEIVNSQAEARFERSHLARHGAYSLDFETVYRVLSPELKRHMEIQHRIQIMIHREFARLGIKFAEPTHRLVSG
jgi:small-conductance mechanosensitive channel